MKINGRKHTEVGANDTLSLKITDKLAMKKYTLYIKSILFCGPEWKDSLIALTTAFCIVTLFLIVSAYGKLVLYSFEEKVARSEAIVIGKIIKVNKSLLGKNSALVHTLKIIKGDFKEQQFTVKYGQFLFYAKEDTTEFIQDESYILFLTLYQSYYRLVGAHDGYYHIRDGGMVRYEHKDLHVEDFIEMINGPLVKN